MKTLAIASRKGGVGKTTVAVNLAACFARAGRRVLLVDLDAQGNATRWLAGDLSAEGTAEAVRAGAAGPGHLRDDPQRAGLVLMPASRSLATLDLALAGEVGGEVALRAVLGKLGGRFDVAIVDCPPALGLATVNALCAADAVLSPTTAGFLPLVGLEQLDDAMARARDRLGARCSHLGYLLFAADEREAVTAETRGMLGRRLMAEVRVSTAAKALPAHGLTSVDDGSDPRGAEDYAGLTLKLGKKLGLRM